VHQPALARAQLDILGGDQIGARVARVGVRRQRQIRIEPSHRHIESVGHGWRPYGRGIVHTGVAVALPEGHVGLVHPRSGLAARLGVTVLNAPGTVDAGYRGEILVNLVNHDRANTVKISRGDRIAQLLVQRVERARFHPVDELPDTVRGAGGHGSTGGHSALLDGRQL